MEDTMPFTEAIAKDYKLWVKWIDPQETYSESQFNKMPVSALIMLIEIKKRKGLLCQ